MTRPGAIRAIVVSDDAEIHPLLSAATDWDLQSPVTSVAQMWHDLESGRLTAEGVSLVVIAVADASGEEAVVAAATMAPWAVTVFLTYGNPTSALLLRTRVDAVIRASREEDPDLPGQPARLFVEAVADAAHAVRAVCSAAATLLSERQHPVASGPVAGSSPGDGSAVPGPPADHAPDQAFEVPARRADRRRASTVGVTAAVGGVGTTTVALLLAGAAALCSAAGGRPRRVLLLDVDDRDGVGPVDLVPVTGVRPEPTADLAAPRPRVESAPRAVRVDVLDVDVLVAPLPPGTAVGDWVDRLVDEADHDLVVVDLPSHLSAAALGGLERVVLVAPMTRPALGRTYRRARAVGRGPAVGAVLTRVLPGIGLDAAEAAALLPGIPLAGVLPAACRDLDLAVNHRSVHRVLLEHPDLAPVLADVAGDLLPGTPMAPATPAMDGYETPAQPPPRRTRRGRAATAASPA